MAILKTEEMRVSMRSDGAIVLRARVGSRDRDIAMDADAAIQIGTALANAGVDVGPVRDGIPQVTEIHLRPFDASGRALLAVTMKDFGGPAIFALDHHWLGALAAAATAALELAQPGGSA
jgi:hypothetical protein